MAKPAIVSGAQLDGFTIGECVHRGGMATLWTVTHPGIAVPLLMKIPRVSEGEDPAAIVSFEMEQMIVPRLAGPHVPTCFGSGDFDRQPYVVIERIPGKTLYDRLGDLPIPYEAARVIAAKMTSFIPTSETPVQLLSGRRWLAVLGSVGQPRDGNPAAAYAMLDTTSREITYCRVPYDVETAADKIRANGLPHWLADRLLAGR